MIDNDRLEDAVTEAIDAAFLSQVRTHFDLLVYNLEAGYGVGNSGAQDLFSRGIAGAVNAREKAMTLIAGLFAPAKELRGHISTKDPGRTPDQ